MIKMKLTDMSLTDHYMMQSSKGYGFCLFSVEDTERYPHGIAALNMFTNELEFHAYKVSENVEQSVMFVGDYNDALGMLEVNKQ